jgi:hypothetical protein
MPTNVALIDLVPPGGTAALTVPPGAYEVVVSRGPEWSIFPDSWPIQGWPVDLTNGDQSVSVTLGHVIDTRGWIGADLHVHAVNSSDSSVANDRRVMSFMGEGVGVICSTDHDFITDFAPTIHALEGDNDLASMIGEELSTFDFGHFNPYPVIRDPSNPVTGGAFDWGGGGDNAHVMRLPDIFTGLRQQFPNAIIQINHGRGTQGALTQLQVDTATLASHVDPAKFRLLPAPDATPTDAKLFSDNFDAIEVQNGTTANTALLNDWMTFLSRGSVKTATAVSDSHYTLTYSAGHSRTYVDMGGFNQPWQFDPSRFATSMRAHRAIGTNGPFVQLTGTRVDAQGNPLGPTVAIGDTISINPKAGEQLLLNVDIQSAEWIDFDTIELYTYAPGRESYNGVENDTWPANRILATQTLNLQSLPIETVPGPNGTTFRRIHVNTSFIVQPQFDTWYMVIVRGSNATHTLFPIVIRGVSCDSTSGVCTPGTSHAYAFTNPIFVDGDGDGAYDHYPLNGTSGPKPPPPLPPMPPPQAPPQQMPPPAVQAAFEQMIHDASQRHCGGK